MGFSGFNDYLEKVESIKGNNTPIIDRIKIFDINQSDKEIKEAIYSLSFEKNEE